ncbi:glutamyl-tRNA reductase [Salinicola halophilus]|uniref:glutamyl-tRNA reductase n=1 Tax=Salinicola halophilus TaxID=184065 RepID=UPI000DA26121|nr:glutamyl-tRNA reductase [Salinicola halophilus]
MTLLALGINHKTAAVDMRERVAFSPSQYAAALGQLRALPDVHEAAVLSTCNRTELYCVTADGGESQLLEWLSSFHGMAAHELLNSAYHYHEGEAARHLMRVAAGLDSMVLGEPQILGQLKDAYQLAREHAGLGSELERLFQQTFSIAKQVRTETSIGENPVSVAYAAVSLASRIFDDFGRARALLIGAGETVELVARHLREAGILGITVANRTLARAEALADDCGGKAIELGGIPQALEQADIVIASTASDLPILGKGMVERALKVRRHRPIFMVDIAVPRDIEPEVGDLDDVFLYSVDDLQQVIAENRRHREVAAHQAERLIEQGVEHWLHERRVRGAGDLIRRYRQHGESLRRDAEAQALAQLARGEDPETVIKRLSHQLANKLMHGPTLRLREASGESRQDIIQAADSLLIDASATTQDSA